MEKIKKIFVLFSILLCVNFTMPTLVYAEEVFSNYYLDCNWMSCSSLSSYPTNNAEYEVSSLNYCTDDNLSIFFHDGQKKRNTITLYDKVNHYYVNLEFIRDYSSINNLIYSQVNFDTSDGGFKRLDTNQSIDGPRVFFVSLEDTSSFYEQFNFYSNYFINRQLGNFYTYSYLTTQTSFNQYLKDNIDDFDLINIDIGNFYVDGIKKELTNVCSSEPEEPEEPEEPTQDINLDYVYVPNYKEGQCIEVLDKDTLRVFENETTSYYSDYYINSHYISTQGQVEVNYQKNCSSLNFTSIGYYRNDFPQILFMVGSLSFL